MKNLFYKFPQNIIKIFSGTNLFWHFLAFALTYLIVASGFDWNYFVNVVKLPWRVAFIPAVLLGGILPLIIPVTLLIIGKNKKNVEILNAGFAIGQAVILGFLISGFYKAFTGRIQPPDHFHGLVSNINYLTDLSHGFRFGVLRGGVFWGWPSTHTTVAFSMSLAAWKLFPKNKIIRTIAIVYAFYVGWGVSITAIHWFSEFVAGAIFGTVIGLTVGQAYLRKMKGTA